MNSYRPIVRRRWRTFCVVAFATYAIGLAIGTAPQVAPGQVAVSQVFIVADRPQSAVSGLVVAPPYLSFNKKLRSLTSEPVLQRAALLIAGETDFESPAAAKAPLVDTIRVGRELIQQRLGDPIDVGRLARELQAATWTRHPHRQQVAEIYCRAATGVEARLFSSAVVEAAHHHHRERARRVARRLAGELGPRIEAVKREFASLLPDLDETVKLRWTVPSLLAARQKLGRETLASALQHRRNEHLLETLETAPAVEIQLTSLEEEINKAALFVERLQLDDLTKRLSENHPLLQAQRRRLLLVEQHIRESRASLRAAERTAALQTLHRQQRELGAQMDYSKIRDSELSAALGDATQARSEVQAKRLLLDRTRASLQELQAWERYLHNYDIKQTGAVLPYSFATHAEAATVRARRWGHLLSIACAIGLALAVALLLERTDRRVHGAHVIRGQLGLPLLGVIADGAHDTAALGTLATTVQTQLRALPRSLMICSAIPGEGKTTVATGVAVALARRGHKVVIVDANEHSPQVANTLRTQHISTSDETPAHWGTDHWDTPDHWTAAQATTEPNLAVVDYRAAADSTSSEALQRLIAQLEAQFDYVIIDTAPLSLFGDALAAGSKVGGVLLVVSAPETHQSQVADARSQLDLTGSPILGVVLNRFSKSPSLVMQGSYGGSDWDH